jgi:DNA-binding MarR family transcriptional regulator
MSRNSSDLPVKDRPQLQLFKAVSRANAAIRDHHRRATKVIGLNLGEFDLLCALGNTEGMRMAALAECMITTPSSVTRICEKMEKRKLVTRSRSQASDREVIAKLTDEGQAMFERAFPPMTAYTTELMNSGLSPAEQARAAELLKKFCAQLTEPSPLILPDE